MRSGLPEIAVFALSRLRRTYELETPEMLHGVFLHLVASALFFRIDTPGDSFPPSSAIDRQTVLVLVENLTKLSSDSAESIKRLIADLKRRPSITARTLAARIEEELRESSRSFEEIVASLKKAAMDDGGTSRLDMMVVSNSDARQGRYRLLRKGDRDFRTEPISIPKSDHPIAKQSPLSSPAALRAALAAAKANFDPSKHDFVLYLRSHGSESMALTSLDIEATLRNAEKAARAGLLYDLSKLPEMLDIALSWTFRRGAFLSQTRLSQTRLSQTRLSQTRLGGGKQVVLAEMADAEGVPVTTKSRLFAELEKSGLAFRAVVMGSCFSSLGEDQVKALPRNVAKVYSVKGGLDYCDWPPFSEMDKGDAKAFYADLERRLEQIFEVQARPSR